MGCSSSVLMPMSTTSFYVENNSEKTLQVGITQMLWTAKVTSLEIEADSAKSKARAKDNELSLEQDSFLLLPTGKSQLFYLPAGGGNTSSQRVFVSIKAVDPKSGELTDVCNKYHPPNDACIVIDKDLHLQLLRRGKKTVVY